MTRPRPLAASVRARLTNHAKTHGETVQFVLLRYAIERLLYRLSQSASADRFIPQRRHALQCVGRRALSCNR